jgi:hypothetical protein
VFEAARTGDVEAVRRAVASGFDPATPDGDGRTIYQIATACDTFFLGARRPQLSGKKEGDVSAVLKVGSTLYAVRRSPARPRPNYTLNESHVNQTADAATQH